MESNVAFLNVPEIQQMRETGQEFGDATKYGPHSPSWCATRQTRQSQFRPETCALRAFFLYLDGCTASQMENNPLRRERRSARSRRRHCLLRAARTAQEQAAHWTCTRLFFRASTPVLKVSLSESGCLRCSPKVIRWYIRSMNLSRYVSHVQICQLSARRVLWFQAV